LVGRVRGLALDDWDRAVAAYEHLLDVRAKYEAALNALIRSKNIDSLPPVEILASEVERAHGAVLADLRIIRMSLGVALPIRAPQKDSTSQ
jgi:hypothetical protein